MWSICTWSGGCQLVLTPSATVPHSISLTPSATVPHSIPHSLSYGTSLHILHNHVKAFSAILYFDPLSIHKLILRPGRRLLTFLREVGLKTIFATKMANDFLGDHPELRSYVLLDVQLTGTTIGHGAYGSVEEVAVPVCGAAKKVHDLLLGSPKITSQFAEELKLMSTLGHPNIVQFLGLCFFPGSRLPALVMERLQTSLHDLLDPETDDAQPPPPTPLDHYRCSRWA